MNENTEIKVGEDGSVTMSLSQLQRIIKQTAQETLQGAGIRTEEDVKNLQEAIDVGAFWRNFRQGFIDGVSRKIATVIIWIVLAGLAMATYSGFQWIAKLLQKGG